MSATAVPSALLPHGGRVLLIRLSALGDVLFALETVASLKASRPDLHLDFLVEDRFAALLQDHPQIDRVLVYPRRHKFRIPSSLKALRRTRYDVVLDLHGIMKSALHVLAARAVRKVGYSAPGSREGVARLYDLAVPLPSPLPHRADMGYHLLRAIGLPGTPQAPQLGVVPPPPALLDGLPHPRVLLHPGTSAFAAFKRWPLERFAELARRLAGRGFGIVISHGPGEADLAAPLLQAAPSARVFDGGVLGLRGLAGALQQVDLAVAADTGPLHIAAAVGTRCVALFGPKNVARYGPRAHGRLQHEVLFAAVPCRPCTLRDCASPQCVLGVGIDEAEAAVCRALEVTA